MGRPFAVVDYLAEMTLIHALRLPSYLSKLYCMNNSTVFGKCRWATADTGEADCQ